MAGEGTVVKQHDRHHGLISWAVLKAQQSNLNAPLQHLTGATAQGRRIHDYLHPAGMLYMQKKHTIIKQESWTLIMNYIDVIKK